MRLKNSSAKDVVGETLAAVLPEQTKPWFLMPHLLKLNLLLIAPLLSAAAGGYDASLMNGLQSMTEWQNKFGDPTGYLLGFVNAAMCFGGLLAVPLCGILPDWIGRKKTLYIGVVGCIVATIIQATSTTLAQLIVSRFIVGAAGQLGYQPSPLLIAEVAYPTHRGKITAMYNCLYYLGGILASWTCYGCTKRSDDWGWRVPVILQAAYPIIQFFLLWACPESPRWLISKNRMDEAKQILATYHAAGDLDSPLVEVEIQEILAAIEMERHSKQSSWKDLVATPGNRKRTYIAVSLGVVTQWSGLGIISYYLTLVLDTIGITSSSMQTLINGLLQVFHFVVCIVASLFVDRLGRRTLFLWSGVGMLVSFIIWTACSATFSKTATASSGRAVLGFIFIFAFHYDIGYMPLGIAYATEIFPFSLRSKGIAVEMFVMYSTLAISAFCNSIAMSAIGWKYYIVFCILLALFTINSYFFYPETNGRSLEEIAELFDGQKIDLEAIHSPEVRSNEKLDHKAEVHYIETVSE